MAEAKYPETLALQQVHGVGALTAVTFVLTLEDKNRLRSSRDAGCFLGLQPRRGQSGRSDPQLGITKAGDRYLRTLLVQCAHHILGPFGPPTALQVWVANLQSAAARTAVNALQPFFRMTPFSASRSAPRSPPSSRTCSSRCTGSLR